MGSRSGKMEGAEEAVNELGASEWMPWFLGASEMEVIEKKEDFNTTGNSNLKNRETGVLWPMGTFLLPSIAHLREEVCQLPNVRKADVGCPLNVLDGIDIGAYQATMKTEDRAMVQIASNMHCLENGNPRTPADCGRLVTGYAADSTQGPAASFGVPAASLLRAHYVFKQDGKSSDEWGQSSSRQVNIIEDISEWCGSCVNGKALFTGTEAPVTLDNVNEVANKVKVGLHSDAQVVFTRGTRRCAIKVLENPYPFVDQICSASICYGFVDSAHRVPQENLNNLARALLRAAYEGAYLAAIKRRRHVLLLTLVGGASFRNPMGVILEELKRAHLKWATHPASDLQEVRLLCYGRGEGKYYEEALNKIDVPSIPHLA